MQTEEPNGFWDSPPELAPTHYLDNRIYTDEAILRAEQKKIFRKTWKFACHESEIKNPGDYRVVEIDSISIIVLRDSDSNIRAFFNVCPHRGARLVRDTAGSLGNERIQCFYHHWNFSLQGACLAISHPRAYESANVRREDVSLRAVRVETAFGLVFLNVDGDAEPLQQFLGSAMESIREPLAGLELLHYHRVEIRANWKLFVETNAEGYHELLHLLNRTTGLSQTAYRKRLWHLHPCGHHTFERAQIAYGRLALEERSSGTLPGMTANGHVVVDLFPDAMVNVRATVVRIDSLTPLTPGLTVLECRGLGRADDSPEVREMRIRHHNQVWGPFGRNLPEDIWAIETQWANMCAGASGHSIIAREEERQATDDAPLRSFYAEWQRSLGVCSHDVEASDPGIAQAGAREAV
jgi:methanesulfonate monooxygenase subunit alpha